MNHIHHKIATVLLSLVGITSLSGCDKWFEVTPSSEIRKQQHYSTVKGFQQTLTGCYISMVSNDLYGKTLTWQMPEILAHQYLETTNPQDRAFFRHEYREESSVVTTIEQVWAKMYNVIVNANDALDEIEAKKDALQPLEYGILKGEFLAIRAFLHFDLLRLYGYGDYAHRAEVLDKKPTLPYVTGLRKDIERQYTGAEYYEMLLKDLTESAALLKQYDPLANPDIDKTSFDIANVEGYYSRRNLHLNYYAVKALEARVHLWFGTPDACEKAREAARIVITAAEDGSLQKNKGIETDIHLMKSGEIKGKTRSFSTEALFAMDAPGLDNATAVYLKPGYRAGDAYALALSPERVKSLFGKDEKDVRLAQTLVENTSTKGFVSIKYANPDNVNNRVNIIRLPEVYYILAEASLRTGKTAEGMRAINTVRSSRALTVPLDEGISADRAMEEIFAEYEREFISEGILFFTQKRLGKKNIYVRGAAPTGGKTMTDKEYVLPFPVFEVQNGRVQ